MNPLAAGLLFFVVVVAAILLWRQQQAVARLRQQLADQHDEERRVLEFLRGLGSAMQGDSRERSLHRTIVEGVVRVLGGDAGALYLIDSADRKLVPEFLTPDCPPFISLPPAVREGRKKLNSFLRLSSASRSEGFLGRCFQQGSSVQTADLGSEIEGFSSAGGPVPVLLEPLAFGGRTLGVLALSRNGGRKPFTPNERNLLGSLAEQASLTLGHARVQRDANDKRRLEKELRTAGEIQRVLLPSTQPDLEGYRVVGMNLPAMMVSGDYYDFVPLEDGHGICIADVAGKGISASLLTAMARSVLRANANRSDSPAEVLGAINRILFPDMREDRFISMAYLVLKRSSDQIVLARAGHDPPLHFRKATGTVEEIKPGGLAIGIDDGPVFERVTRDRTMGLAPGDVLLLYTDGFTEALDPAGEEFGKGNLLRLFSEKAGEGAEAILEHLKAEIRDFMGGHQQMDDITLVVIEKL
ncbi:MAG: GAF domain-containing SpoIIE family protein phosphatase [Verrucomicrobiota bacterium]